MVDYPANGLLKMAAAYAIHFCLRRVQAALYSSVHSRKEHILRTWAAPSRFQARRLAVFFGAMLAAVPASADKRLPVNLKHPPTLGNSLAAARVVVGPVAGDCAARFSEMLTVDMAAHGVLVMSSLELASVATRHHIPIPSPLDAAASAQLAGAIGPAALVAISVTRCEARQLPTFLSGGLPATHVSRTEGHFEASVRFTDLANGQEIAAQNIRVDAHKDNESQTGVADHPAAPEVRELAVNKALQDAQHLYLPWIEHREIALSDEKDCNLKASFDLVKTGDYEGAARVARSNAQACQSKSAAAAWYNLGAAEMLASHYEAALPAFDESLKLRNNRAVAELRSDCSALASAQARHSLAKGVEPARGSQPANARTGILLTNDFIIKLVQGSISGDEIIQMIATQPVQFKLEPADIQVLKQAGVPDAVVAAMRAR